MKELTEADMLRELVNSYSKEVDKLKKKVKELQLEVNRLKADLKRRAGKQLDDPVITIGAKMKH